MNALRQHNPELWGALVEQAEMFRDALLGDDDEEVWRHGDALSRGWSHALVARVRELWPGAELVRVCERGELQPVVEEGG